MRLAVLFGAFALASCGGGVSKSELAEAIKKSDTVAHCLNLSLADRGGTDKAQFDAGFLNFVSGPFGDLELPPFLQALVTSGILVKDGVFERPVLFSKIWVAKYKIAKGYENLFRMKADEREQQGSVYLCGGDMDVEVLNFTVPAEGQNMTEVQYRFEIKNTPPALRSLIESGQIPRFETTAPGGQEVLMRGEGTATVVKTNNGWEVMKLPFS
jgi:hypothetical protein